MRESECERLLEEFMSLLEETVNNPSLRARRVRAWFKSVPSGLRDFAFNLTAIEKYTGNISIHTGSIIHGDVTMTDNRKSTIVHGDVTGANVGTDGDASVIAQQIQNIKNSTVSANIDAEGQKLIQAAADEIGKIEDGETRGAALDDLASLVKELSKSERKPGLIARALGGLKNVAGSLPTVATLVKWASVSLGIPIA